jgi:cytidine deaminase
MNPQKMVEIAREAKENAYEPYSNYSVGAVVVAEDGSVYKGVNIENITFDMCSHAERTAVKSAIANGHRNFDALAISTQEEDGVPPCGTCRQYLAEFCSDDFVIYSDKGTNVRSMYTANTKTYKSYTLGDIFPSAFRPQHVDDATN